MSSYHEVMTIRCLYLIIYGAHHNYNRPQDNHFIDGRLAFIRSDNGPEFLDEGVEGYLKEQGTKPRFIDPVAPWQKSHVESFNGKVRDELLDHERL